MHKMPEAADISTRHPVFFIVDVGRMVEARGEGNSISAQHNKQLNAFTEIRCYECFSISILYTTRSNFTIMLIRIIQLDCKA